MSKLSVGILGAGQIVAEAHLPVLNALAEVDLAWIMDVDRTRAKNVAASFGCRAVPPPSSPRDLPHADVVLVAIPYGARHPYIEALATSGVALYVEKPFALTLAEHDRYTSLAAPERIACGFQRRMSPALPVLQTLVADELMGPLQRIEVEFGRPGLVTGGRYSGNLAMAGGGVLFEVGVHPLDFALHAVKATSVSVDRVEMQRHDGFDIHTDAGLTVGMANGATVPFDLVVTNLRFTNMSVVFTFSSGQASVEIFGDNVVKVGKREGSHAFALSALHSNNAMTSAQFFAKFWRSFLAGIADCSPNSTSAANSRLTTSAVEQLYRMGSR